MTNCLIFYARKVGEVGMILIDLPMPEACDVCPFNYDFCWCNAFRNHDEWEKYSDDWNDHVCDRETRPEYCPLKEQEAEIRQLRLALDIAKGTCKGIAFETDEKFMGDL